MPNPPRTSVYIDAFNLYYGALKQTSCKWLNLAALCQAYPSPITTSPKSSISRPESVRAPTTHNSR